MILHELPVEKATSAGGVVLRSTDDNIEVLICNSFRRRIWALPKGTPYQGEDLVETAVREVREETGLEVKVMAEVGSINYWFKQEKTRYNKTVYFFLMEPVSGSLEQHDPEFDIVEWVSLEEAYKRMSYKNEINMVSQAVDIFRRK